MVAEAIRGLTLRRRQSIDTVRSSEFGEGGRWDRAWAGSDGEDEEDDYEMDQRNMLPDFGIEGKSRQDWGALEHLGNGKWTSTEEQKRRTLTAGQSSATQLPALHDAAGAAHVVSLMPSSIQKTKQRLEPPDTTAEHGSQAKAETQARLQRRDTMMSMMGDIGQISPSPSRMGNHQHTDSSATIGGTNPDHRLSYASQSSRSNAHVYVWPPTPAASEHGGSGEGTGDEKRVTKGNRDTLLAYPAGVGIGQRATVEYAGTEHLEQMAKPSQSSPLQPMSPSAALSQPLDSPILGADGVASRKRNSGNRVSSGSGSGHPAGRRPPQPPALSNPANEKQDGYSDPNQPLGALPFGELGRARRKAIQDHDGRESLVSDLDVETLRLDGSGGSEEWDSRRGSTSSLGSFSSEKIRDQRQRRSQASIMSSYSDKRSSSGTIQDLQPRQPLTREIQHQSWNDSMVRRGESQPSPQLEKSDPFARKIGPPKRSNTGPDSYLTQSHLQQQQQQQQQQQNPGGMLSGSSIQHVPSTLPSHKPMLIQTKSNTSTVKTNGGSSLTFSTPQPEREVKKQQQQQSGIAVKGAVTNSQAERFLTLAITHHESGDLSRSAYYFERSAKVEGGCVVGMCMWGMALREGWGVRKDQKKGFEWISRAAAKAGEMMAGNHASGNKSEGELKAIRSELKLSVYELGKCFCYGWGVKMDKPMSLEYFELAAKLGDSDAQAEAGALLAAGKGCKKDLKKAAMYYRMAEAQGYDTVGLSWIHKDKYDPVPSK